MVVLGGGGVLMSEVPLYSFFQKMSLCFWGEMNKRFCCAPKKAVSADSVSAPHPLADPRSRLVRIEPESSIPPSQILDLVPSISIRRTL